MPVNTMGERYQHWVMYEIPLLENCPPFYPTNSELTYVYMIPSTRDYIFTDYGRDIEIRKLNDESPLYEVACFGELYERMSEKERVALEPNLDKLIQLIEERWTNGF